MVFRVDRTGHLYGPVTSCTVCPSTQKIWLTPSSIVPLVGSSRRAAAAGTLHQDAEHLVFSLCFTAFHPDVSWKALLVLDAGGRSDSWDEVELLAWRARAGARSRQCRRTDFGIVVLGCPRSHTCADHVFGCACSCFPGRRASEHLECPANHATNRLCAPTLLGTAGTLASPRETLPTANAHTFHQTFLDASEVTDRILSVVKNFDQVDPSKVTPEVKFADDLGLDSLDIVEVVMAIEDEFAIEIPDQEADKISSIGEAVEYISSHPMAK